MTSQSHCHLCEINRSSLTAIPIGVSRQRLSKWPRDLKAIFEDLAPESGPDLFQHLAHTIPDDVQSIETFSQCTHQNIGRSVEELDHSDEWLIMALAIHEAAIEILNDPWKERMPPPPKRRLREGKEIPGGSSSYVFSNITSERPKGLLWIEVISMGDSQISGWAAEKILHEVFNESRYIAKLNTTIPGSKPKDLVYTFTQRCRASKADHLLNLYNLDKSLASTSAPSWNRPPRENIDLARSHRRHRHNPEIGPIHPAQRSHAYLAIENGIRRELSSIKKSWPSYGSAWRAWASFCDATFPTSPHFPADAMAIRAFAAHFRNPDTLKQYLGHLRYLHFLLSYDPSAFKAAEIRLVRGSLVGHIRLLKGRITAIQTKAIVKQLLIDDHTSLARFVVIGRQWLMRIMNELYPLQIDGRSHLPQSSLEWHSMIQLSRDEQSVHITLRSRKNEAKGCTIARKCICQSQGALLCGVCSIKAMITEHQESGHAPSKSIFHAIDMKRAREIIRDTARKLNIPELQSFNWHFIRRGMATDMLRYGSSMAQILVAGGWRSNAFIRYLLQQDLDEKEAANICIDQSESEDDGHRV